nr:hypothetical protein [Leptolyngbya sp. FACHB-261]
MNYAQTQPEDQSRRERGNEVIDKLSGRAGQPVLNALRQDFPFLADAITDYSLGFRELAIPADAIARAMPLRSSSQQRWM